jgi:hypothetical protein
MESSFLDERCDAFMNESEIKLEERIESERGLKKFQVVNQKMMIQCD